MNKTELIAIAAENAGLTKKDTERVLNAAIDAAEAAADAAAKADDAALKAVLESKIDTADAALDTAIKAVQKNLDDAKAALDAKDGELQTFVIVVCVMSSVAICGSGAFVTWFFIDRKKKF